MEGIEGEGKMDRVTAIQAFLSRLWLQVAPTWHNLTTVGISVMLFALLLDYMKHRKRSPRFPPGPASLPFLGNLLALDIKNPHSTAQHLAKRFGAAFSVQVAWQECVVLNGFKMVKEALGQKAEAFSDRPHIPLLRLMGFTKNCEGLTLARLANGWREQRRFVVSALKMFGMGKKTLEMRVSEEAEYLCSEFKAKEGSPFSPHNLVHKAVGNIIWSITFGDRFEYNDGKFQKIMDLTEGIVNTVLKYLPQILAAGSLLPYIPGPHHQIRKYCDEACAMLKEFVDEHKKTRDPTSARDLIDAFLEEIEKAKNKPESSFSEQNLMYVVMDVYMAGTETTSFTLLWGLMFMVLHPDVQKRVHEEIDKELGKDKSPIMEDRPKLPYTMAVIHEIQRFADIIPLSFPYMTHQDVEVGQFVIPKETIVFSHLSSVLKDETMWEKPHEFYPEHFLDADGQFVKREAFLPFSAGRHACPGEQLAKMELFIIFTSLLQHFTFGIPENYPRPKEDEKGFALIISPAPYHICAIPR